MRSGCAARMAVKEEREREKERERERNSCLLTLVRKSTASGRSRVKTPLARSMIALAAYKNGKESLDMEVKEQLLP
jgi:hypothetical protein